jgi:hypothetical protein
MTSPDDGRKGTPRERFRNILSAEHEDDPAREARKPAVVNLPRIADAPRESTGLDPRFPEDARHRPETALSSPYLRTFWTVGTILSVVANVVLARMLITGRGVPSPGSSEALLTTAYASLTQIENAHIRATIPLQASLSTDPSVPITTSTRISLARDALVRGAHVTISGGGLSIDSPADVTLPAGTELDVNIDLAALLQSGLPVTAVVALDIPVRDTELQPAFKELKETLRQLVCARSPGATLSDGTPICR